MPDAFWEGEPTPCPRPVAGENSGRRKGDPGGNPRERAGAAKGSQTLGDWRMRGEADLIRFHDFLLMQARAALDHRLRRYVEPEDLVQTAFAKAYAAKSRP